MAAQTRLNILRNAVRAETDLWATQRVRRLYADHGYDAPQRSTARRDLEHLVTEGLLERLGPENNRHYLRKSHT